MKYSLRAVAIARLLLESQSRGIAEGGYTALGDIAAELGVSTKTVSREVTALEELLAEHDVQLVRKAGAGMRLEGDPDDIGWLEEALLGMDTEEAYTPEERRSIIVSKLLSSQEPIKMFALSSSLKVTDSTISNDLDKLEDWFTEQRLKLVRRHGLGVYVEGDEKSLRQAIVKYIYDNVDEKKLLSLVDENLTKSMDEAGGAEKKTKEAMSYLLNLVDQQIIKRLEKLVHEVEVKLNKDLSDQAFVGLVVHLSLAVQRIRKHEAIEVAPEMMMDLRTRKEFEAAQLLADCIQQEFDIEVPEDEVGYITMHLLGARNQYRSESVSVSVMDKFHLVRLAKSIMTMAENETGKKLSRNTGLLAGLVNHLGPSISRLKMNMDIRNPLLTEMQQSYPELMVLARKCVSRLEKLIGRELPDSEIAYIAMHLGAAMLDGEAAKKREYNAVVACPTGMGTSRLLASRIRKHFDNIKIADITSTLKLNDVLLEKCGAEMVIATVPVENLSVPVVVVNSLLTDQDLTIIQEQINKLSLLQSKGRESEEKKSGSDFVEALEKMAQYNQAIVQLLNNFFFAEIDGESDVQTISEKAATMVTDDKATQQGIIRGLLAREEAGSTLIHGTNMILLHCASSFTTELRFGVIHLKHGFYYPESPEEGEKQELLRTVMVMLAPKEASQLFRNTIGHISTVLLDRWGLIGILHEGDRDSIFEELAAVFKEFYRSKFEELMEG